MIMFVMMLLILSMLATASGEHAQSDPAVEWLLEQSEAAAPSTQPAAPATQAVSPFVRAERDDARVGRIHLSNGEEVSGRIWTTPEKPLRVWDELEGEFKDVPFQLVRSIDARVMWQRNEAEWRFRESGSDEKVYTGQTYPARAYVHTIALVNGQKVVGSVVAPLHVETEEGRRTFVLHKRHKGEAGQRLVELVYVRRMELEQSGEKGE